MIQQPRDIINLRVVEDQQGLAGNSAADVALTDGRYLLTALGIKQRHVQFADLKYVHIGDRQTDEHAQHPRQQFGGAAHGDVGHFAEGIAEADGGQTHVGAEQGSGIGRQGPAQRQQRGFEVSGVGRLANEAAGTERQCAADRFLLDIAGHHDDVRLQSLLAHARQHTEAVEPRHGQVKEYYFAAAGADGVQAVEAVVGLAYPERPVRGQGAHQLLAGHAGIVTDQQRNRSGHVSSFERGWMTA